MRNGEPGTNPLSERLWNFGTVPFYKCGAKPWKVTWAREGVCYVEFAYKLGATSAYLEPRKKLSGKRL